MLLLVESLMRAASTATSLVAMPMALADRSAADAASTSMRQLSGRACWRPPSRLEHVLSFQ
jgi:hypothetical protein